MSREEAVSTGEPLRRSLEIRIRPARFEDAPALEWFGLYSAHRPLIDRALQRHLAGESLALVAEFNGFPVGQVWVDFSHRARATGTLWALRVFPPFQRLAIGTSLVREAERALVRLGFAYAEIGAEKVNRGARRLYERLGYRVARDELFVPVPGSAEAAAVGVVDQWILRKGLALPERAATPAHVFSVPAEGP